MRDLLSKSITILMRNGKPFSNTNNRTSEYRNIFSHIEMSKSFVHFLKNVENTMVEAYEKIRHFFFDGKKMCHLYLEIEN